MLAQMINLVVVSIAFRENIYANYLTAANSRCDLMSVYFTRLSTVSCA